MVRLPAAIHLLHSNVNVSYICSDPSLPFQQQIKNVVVSFLLMFSVFWFLAEASLLRAVVIPTFEDSPIYEKED